MDDYWFSDSPLKANQKKSCATTRKKNEVLPTTKVCVCVCVQATNEDR